MALMNEKVGNSIGGATLSSCILTFTPPVHFGSLLFPQSPFCPLSTTNFKTQRTAESKAATRHSRLCLHSKRSPPRTHRENNINFPGEFF